MQNIKRIGYQLYWFQSHEQIFFSSNHYKMIKRQQINSKRINQRIQMQKTHWYWVIHTYLPRLGSWTCPYPLRIWLPHFQSHAFLLELDLCSVEGFSRLVEQAFSSSVRCFYSIKKKIAWLRNQLWHWAKVSFGSIKLRKLDILHELETLDVAKESCRLILEECRQEITLHQNLGNLLKQEYLYWNKNPGWGGWKRRWIY